MFNLLFFLSAAGLGASFAALYKANSYIAKGTFDPNYHASYWIRFFLGIIAGLVLSIMISEKGVNQMLGVGDPSITTDGVDKIGSLLADGIVRPLLALLGGFSAGLLYTILNRLVETVESLFEGSEKSRTESRLARMQVDSENALAQQNLKTANQLIKVRQEITEKSSPEDIRKNLDAVLDEIVPDSQFLNSNNSAG